MVTLVSEGSTLILSITRLAATDWPVPSARSKVPAVCTWVPAGQVTVSDLFCELAGLIAPARTKPLVADSFAQMVYDERLHCPAYPSGSSRAPTISRELGGPKKS